MVTPGVPERDEALARVEEAANRAWIAVAKDFVTTLSPGEQFTTDRVWWHMERSGVTTPEPRALGAVMKNLCDREVIEKTGETRPTTRPQAHARPIPVWRRR